MQEVDIITPELAPGVGGVADYTLHIADEWRDLCRCRFILPEGAPAGAAREVEFVARDASALRKRLPRSGGKVLLQYSAYGFDRRGYPRWLLPPLIEWRKQDGGLLVVMFHEIWTLRPVINKHHLLQHLHRHTIGKLVSVADAVFTATTDQAEHIRKLHPRCAVQVLPVGSNIPAIARLDETRAPAVAVCFGRESRRLVDLRLLRDDLHALAAKGVIRKIVTCGAVSSSEEAELLRTLPLADGFEQRGQLAPDEISHLLARATFGLSGQDALSVEKSGTVKAYAAHALNIISPSADPSGAEPSAWLLHPRQLLNGVSPAELKSRAESLRDWQERTASWREIARRFADALELERQ